jgi:hypothetical protein
MRIIENNLQYTDIVRYFLCIMLVHCRSHWSRGLRRSFSAARLLRLSSNPTVALTFVCYDYCVLSGRGLCDELIIRLGESYLLWRVVVYDLENSKTRRLKPATGL